MPRSLPLDHPSVAPPRAVPHGTRPPRSTARKVGRRILTLTGLGLAGLVAGLLSGCSTTPVTTSAAASSQAPAPSFAALAGNWRFATGTQIAGTQAPTSLAAATQLTVLGGSLDVNASAVSGILHPLTAGQCAPTTATIPVTGSIDAKGRLSLAGQTGSTTVHITGTVADDRHSLLSPTLTAAGGACLAAPATASIAGEAGARDGPTPTAQQYQPVTGTYSGTLTGDDGESFPLTTTVTQLDQPDTSGAYHIQGTAVSATNPCLPGSITATASTLSGGTLSATYTDAGGTTTISAAGSASPDAIFLTLTHWQITSACGSGQGTATLTRQ